MHDDSPAYARQVTRPRLRPAYRLAAGVSMVLVGTSLVATGMALALQRLRAEADVAPEPRLSEPADPTDVVDVPERVTQPDGAETIPLYFAEARSTVSESLLTLSGGNDSTVTISHAHFLMPRVTDFPAGDCTPGEVRVDTRMATLMVCGDDRNLWTLR